MKTYNVYSYSEVVDIFIFAGIFQKVAEMSLKKVVDRGYIFIFFIFIVFLLTNIFNFFKKSLKFQMFKFLSLIFVRFTKSHWKSRWFSKNFCRNFPTFRRPTTSLMCLHICRREQNFWTEYSNRIKVHRNNIIPLEYSVQKNSWYQQNCMWSRP